MDPVPRSSVSPDCPRPRVASMKICAPHLCNYAGGGECPRACTALHRPVLLDMPPGGKAEIVECAVEGAEQQIDVLLPDDDRLTTALHTYRTHRALGRCKAISRAWQSLFRIPVQPFNT